MIILFSASVEELEASNGAELDEFISELARASRRGHHYVIFDRAAAQWCLHNVYLSRPDSAELSRSLTQQSERLAYYRNASVKMEVAVGTIALETDDGNVFRIGHRSLLASNFLDRSELLVENSGLDGEFYRHVLNAVRKHLRTPELNYAVSMGGGSAIVGVFDEKIIDRKQVSVLVDSDKKHPAHPSSAVTCALRKTADRQCFLGCIVELPCRDVENMIPLEVIDDNSLCPMFPAGDMGFLKGLRSDDMGDPCDPLRYFDMKIGVRKDLVETMPGGDCRNWVESTFVDTLGGEIREVAGFGDALLKVFLESGPAVRDFHSTMKTDAWMAAYGVFFHRVCWFFAGGRCSRT